MHNTPREPPGTAEGIHETDVASGLLIGPLPADDFRFIDTVFVSVGPAIDLGVTESFLGVCTGSLELRHPVDHIHGDAKAVHLVADR